MGSAAFSLDKHAQSKTIVRAQVLAVHNSAKGITELQDIKETRTLLTDINKHGEGARELSPDVHQNF